MAKWKSQRCWGAICDVSAVDSERSDMNKKKVLTSRLQIITSNIVRSVIYLLSPKFWGVFPVKRRATASKVRSILLA